MRQEGFIFQKSVIYSYAHSRFLNSRSTRGSFSHHLVFILLRGSLNTDISKGFETGTRLFFYVVCCQPRCSKNIQTNYSTMNQDAAYVFDFNQSMYQVSNHVPLANEGEIHRKTMNAEIVQGARNLILFNFFLDISES